jgi:AhpD family alkylhydroperoxidase
MGVPVINIEEEEELTMKADERLRVQEIDPTAYQAVAGMEKYVRSSDLERSLRELIKIRASQLNGCAYCLDMHAREAREAGESQRRLDVLSAWREVPSLFTEREQAAIALTEFVTRIGDDGVPDEVWNDVTQQFTEKEVVALLMAISTINIWNRLAVSTHQKLPELVP